MRCFDAAQIARAATLDLDDPHLGECLDCRRRLEADRTARTALRALPVPALSRDHRRALATELIAVAQRGRVHARRPKHVAIIAAAGALAAALALVLAWPARVAYVAVPAPAPASEELTSTSFESVARVERPAPPPPLASPRIEPSDGARLRHVTGARRDVVTLADGMIEIDTRAARDVEVRVGDSVVRVDDAAVRIRARRRTIVSVQVVVGTARVTSAAAHVTLHRDSLWQPGPSARQRSLDAFREAWIALRGGRNREAMELFDRVTDPVVLEEATYWAAVAARRSGDTALADERFAKFAEAFPDSQFALGLRDGTP